MSDRKAVNRYYPPDFDPSKHGSINKFRNSHPLRERAKRLSEGILVIRFEMPYNIWCGGCGKHIGMGVRYNAEKTKVGNYYSTPIYRFRMKCHLCDHYFEMETDPMNCDYSIVTGASRKNQKWDMAENEQVLTEDRETVKKLAADPMFKLEHGVDDTKKLEKVIPTLHELETTQTSWKNDFDQNRMLRQKFRIEKKDIKSSLDKDQALLAKSSLAIALVPEHEDDKKLASLMKYSTVDTSEEMQKRKRAEISNRSIFSSKSLQSSSTSSSSSSPSSSTPKSPSKTASLPSKVSSRTLDKKQVNLIEKLKATKRAGIGFSDFGSEPDRKVAKKRPEALTGIGVVRKKRKDGDDDHSSEMLGHGKNGVVPQSRVDELSLEVKSDVEQQRESVAERVGPHLTDEQQGLQNEKAEGVAVQDWKTKNLLENATREERALKHLDPSTGHHKTLASCPSRHDPIRNSIENADMHHSVSRMQGAEHIEPGVKSLVSCDYSSSESDD